ncbi:MAG: hypothetical protein MJ249_03405 [Kiritimatiellae bacterium]|nr:hypothetical protein [Kiritimatiellia bacterium]
MLRISVARQIVLAVFALSFLPLLGVTNSYIRVSVVEFDRSSTQQTASAGDARKSLLAQFKAGKTRTRWSGVVSGTKAKFMDAEEILVPTGFQYDGNVSPNVMNYSRRLFGTQIEITGCRDRSVSLCLKREYVIGLKEALAAKPKNFVPPAVKRVQFEFDVARDRKTVIAGGEWREDGGVVCSVVVEQLLEDVEERR